MALSARFLGSTGWCGALMVTLAGVQPAAAVTIDAVFSSSITSDPNAAAIESAIDYAFGTIDSLYSNPGTVGIVFTEGSGSFVAETETAQVGFTYGQYTGQLAAVAAAEPNNTVLTTAIAHLATGNKPGPGGFVEVTTADARVALGTSVSGCFTSAGAFVSSCGQVYDGVITLNTGLGLNYGTSAVGGEYSAIASIEHEIDEILGGGGTGSMLNNIPCGGTKAAYPDVGVLDLYRYASPGVPSFSSCNGTTAYLSVDGGSTPIVAFNDNPGSDLGDFLPNGYVQSAFASTGTVPGYTPATPEFAMMESIGYDNAVPEPASLALLGFGLAGLLGVRSRRRAAIAVSEKV